MDKAVIRCLLITAFLFISLFSCGKTDHDSRIVEPSSLLEIGMTEDEVIDMVEKNEQYTFQRCFPLSYICVFDQNNKTETLALTDREKGIVIAVYDTVTADPPTRQQTDRIEKGMSAAEVLVMSRVMRKIDFGIWQKSITEGGLTALWLLFSRQGAKGQGRRYAARLALDAL